MPIPRNIIQLFRGNKSNVPALAEGEPAFVKDEKRVYIGDSTGNIPMAMKSDIDSLGSQLADYTNYIEPINVFDYTKATVDKYASNYDPNGDVIITNKLGAAYSAYIPVKQGESYIAPNALGGVGVYATAIIFDANKKGIRRIMAVSAWDSLNPFTITDANAAYMIVNVNNAYPYRPLNQMMIVKGNVYPDEYIPYGKQYLGWYYPKPESKNTKVFFPNNIYGIKGEELRVYHRGCISCVNPYNFIIQRDNLQSNARYVSFPTTSAATNQDGKTLTVKDQITGKIISKKYSTAKLTVTDPATKSNPATVKNILCIGDSLTDAGVWTGELARRLIETGGTPAGYGWANYKFIGTKTDGSYKNEGNSGYSWEDYAYAPDDSAHGRPEVTTNPFWNSTLGKLDFKKYMTDNSFTGDIDYAVIMLGWNDWLALLRDVDTIIATAKIFVNALHTDYPNCKILLCGLNTTSPYPCSKTEMEIYTVNDFILRLSDAYDNKIANDATYSSYVRYVPITACFDAEYGMQHSQLPANSRTTETIKYCTDQVHPASNGYLQMADTILATFLTLI